MSETSMQKRFPEKFEAKATRQTTDSGHKVADFASNLEFSTWSLYRLSFWFAWHRKSLASIYAPNTKLMTGPNAIDRRRLVK